MQPSSNPNSIDLLKRLQTAPLAWHSGNRLVLFERGHWLFVTLSNVGREDGAWWIGSLNFMREERAVRTLELILPNGRLRPYADISPLLEGELAAKVLSSAADYRAWLSGGEMILVAGFTTDTLQMVEGELQTQIARLARMMARGGAGPYVNFRRPVT